MPKVKVLNKDEIALFYSESLAYAEQHLPKKVVERIRARIAALEKINVGDILSDVSTITDARTHQPTFYRVNYEGVSLLFAADEVSLVT